MTINTSTGNVCPKKLNSDKKISFYAGDIDQLNSEITKNSYAINRIASFLAKDIGNDERKLDDGLQVSLLLAIEKLSMDINTDTYNAFDEVLGGCYE